MEEALIKRILPHSIEAEQSVIGSMILDRDAILVASEILTSDDFYQKQYGIIFDAMVELCNEGKPVDLVTLQNRLKEKELPPDISSMEYVRDLISAVPTSANVKYYAKIVSEKAVLRRLIKANEEIANTCYLEKENTEIILEEAEKKLFNILQRRNNEEYVPIQQVVLNAINNIEKASKLKGSVTGIPTGFMDLDYKTSGMHPSDLVLIAARPSMGKTAFVLNIAQYMAFRKDVTVAIFSLEMSKEQLVNRLLAMESHVDSQNMRTGNLKDEDWTKLVEGADIIGKSNLIIDDTPGISIAEMRSKCRKYKLEHNLGIIMIDYLKQEIFVGEDLYVFEAEDAGEILNWHGEDNSSAGEYITGLIRNRMSGGNITAVTLRELFYEKYKEDKILRLPIVKIRNGSLEVEV